MNEQTQAKTARPGMPGSSEYDNQPTQDRPPKLGEDIQQGSSSLITELEGLYIVCQKLREKLIGDIPEKATKEQDRLQMVGMLGNIATTISLCRTLTSDAFGHINAILNELP